MRAAAPAEFPTGALTDSMGPVLVPALIVAGVVLVVGFAVASFVAERRRRERLFTWSVERRWSWTDSDPRLVDMLPGEPFGRGHSRSVRSAMNGRWDGRPALAFDYSFKETKGSGKDRRTQTYHHAVVAVQLPVPLPRLHVGPENVFHRIAQSFGADDIDVESHDFNRRYRVQADDRRAAFAILHPRLVELLTQVEPVEWRIDLATIGPVVLTWWSGRLEPVQIQQRLILLDRIVDSVPDYVWRDAGWEPNGTRPGD